MAAHQPSLQSPVEEIANSASHAVALIAVLVGLSFLSSAAEVAEVPWGFWVYAGSLVAVYVASVLYHAAPHRSRAKALFERLDYQAIFVFIAGTYTPFGLAIPYLRLRTLCLAVLWCIALAGVVLKALGRLTRPPWSTGLYLAMGWLAVAAAIPILPVLSAACLVWLVLGGVAYTLGLASYWQDGKRRFSHLIWHLCAMAGTACHCVAVAATLWPPHPS